MSDQASQTEQQTCRFPGCNRKPAAGDGTGRPPEYCDDPGHNRGAAWRERQRLKGAGHPRGHYARDQADAELASFHKAFLSTTVSGR